MVKNDLISRQAAIDVVYDYMDDCGIIDRNWHANGIVHGIEKLPSAQLERKKGKWLNDKGLYRCSCCNQLWTEWWAASKPIERMKKECPYCPMCGSYNGEESDNAEIC